MERYSRQLGIAQLGIDGQKRLLGSSVFVVGAGGLGSALLYCLAGAGVGRITVADGDTVRLSNLNRQYLHNTGDIGCYKADSAAVKLRALNPDIIIEPVKTWLDSENADALIAGHSIVLAAADNLKARLDANRACASLGIPLINGGISGMYGTVQTVIPGKSACLACVYGVDDAPEPQTLSFAPVVTCISAFMAQSALLLLLGLPDPLKGGILYYDGLNMSTETVPLERRADCPHCR